jgi:hypothetical protein
MSCVVTNRIEIAAAAGMTAHHQEEEVRDEIEHVRGAPGFGLVIEADAELFITE